MVPAPEAIPRLPPPNARKRKRSPPGALEITLRQGRRERRRGAKNTSSHWLSTRTGGPHAQPWRLCPYGGVWARSGEARPAREWMTMRTHGEGLRQRAGGERWRWGGDERWEERMCEEERLHRGARPPVHQATRGRARLATKELRRGDADGSMLWHRVCLDAEMRPLWL